LFHRASSVEVSALFFEYGMPFFLSRFDIRPDAKIPSAKKLLSMKVYLVHFRQTPLTFLICPDMVGVLRGKMAPVLRPGVPCQWGKPLWTPRSCSALRFSQLKRQKTKCKSKPRHAAKRGKF